LCSLKCSPLFDLPAGDEESAKASVTSHTRQ
jgi:hypothetical protein